MCSKRKQKAQGRKNRPSQLYLRASSGVGYAKEARPGGWSGKCFSREKMMTENVGEELLKTLIT